MTQDKAYIDSEVLPRLNALKSRLDGGRATGAVIGYVCLTRKLMNKLGITYIKPEDKKEQITESLVDTPAFGTR